MRTRLTAGALLVATMVLSACAPTQSGGSSETPQAQSAAPSSAGAETSASEAPAEPYDYDY